MGLLPFDLAETPRESPEPISVTQASRMVVRALDDALPGTMRIRGEISGLTIRNGHWFFSLRDSDSSIDAVMWASQARVNSHRPVDGDSVLVTGRIGHWPRGGRTRLEARRLEPDGEGDLRAAFLKLCRELRELGWFDESAKKPLPSWPSRVAVVTSAQGAAVTDVVATARSRFPATALIVVDVRVQGPSAAGEVSAAIRRLDQSAGTLGLDAIIVTRGGGSAEDLEAFNQREVAQAVHDASTPVVAAIGHESDTSIIELVADARASTPTQAVTILLPDRNDVLERFDSLSHRLVRACGVLVESGGEQARTLEDRLLLACRVRSQHSSIALDGLARRLFASRPDRLVKARMLQVAQLEQRLNRSAAGIVRQLPSPSLLKKSLDTSLGRHLARLRNRISAFDRTMAAIDPQAVLDRGYSLTMDSQGRAIRSIEGLEPGEMLETRIADGSIRSRIESSSDSNPDSDTV